MAATAGVPPETCQWRRHGGHAAPPDAHEGGKAGSGMARRILSDHEVDLEVFDEVPGRMATPPMRMAANLNIAGAGPGCFGDGGCGRKHHGRGRRSWGNEEAGEGGHEGGERHRRR